MTLISRRDLLQTALATTAGITLASPPPAFATGRLFGPRPPRTVGDLDTPAFIIDLDVLEKNIRDMANHCREVGIPLHVHCKTNKIPQIAHMVMREGAAGIVCQKLGEAEVMVAGGVRENILIPYNLLGRPKLERLSRLLEEAPLTVAVDSAITARGISEQLSRDGRRVRMLIELDTGGGRVGVQSPQDALALAQEISRMPAIDLRGVMTYPSNPRAQPFIEETVDLFHRAGLGMEEISGGGTGAEQTSKDIGCTVTRSGSYVYEGLRRINNTTNPPNPLTCPCRMVTTVVSTPTATRVVIDGGQKTFQRNPENPFGYVLEHPEARITGLSEEHGTLDVSDVSHRFTVGEKLTVIPRHAGHTINLHDVAYAVRGNDIVAIWPIAARGRVQ
jgi:D-serine deaminase-like pyridoxal phosphate-dependent protein